jgi:PadR family transcriptional regulator, regulatory protein PadR
LKGHVDLLLLSTLRTGPLHGYAVVEKLRGMSDGAFELAEGMGW